MGKFGGIPRPNLGYIGAQYYSTYFGGSRGIIEVFFRGVIIIWIIFLGKVGSRFKGVRSFIDGANISWVCRKQFG